ncbi:cytochrome-c oxidase [Brevibacillus sp. NRS-1366]|uniref:cytochrome-c oxidase n=1 Tax=Brevibacillus sp. NRS-1366 TaxID=3233899 RepID=UPI003D1AB740
MAARFLKIAAVYFVIAIILGIVMGITKAFAYASVHAHLNLAGWVSLAIIGLIYRAYPQTAKTPMATWHFWLHNISLPVMQGSLFLMILTQTESFVVGTIIGSLGLGVGILLFAWNLWQHVRE